MFFFTFNDFFGPLLYAGEKRTNWTLSLGLAPFRTLHQVEWNLTMAATLLVHPRSWSCSSSPRRRSSRA